MATLLQTRRTKMIWVYVVVMAMGSAPAKEDKFIVHATNLAFLTEESCQEWREYDMLRLYNTRPNENAKAVSQCFSLPLFKQGTKS